MVDTGKGEDSTEHKIIGKVHRLNALSLEDNSYPDCS